MLKKYKRLLDASPLCWDFLQVYFNIKRSYFTRKNERDNLLKNVLTPIDINNLTDKL